MKVENKKIFKFKILILIQNITKKYQYPDYTKYNAADLPNLMMLS